MSFLEFGFNWKGSVKADLPELRRRSGGGCSCEPTCAPMQSSLAKFRSCISLPPKQSLLFLIYVCFACHCNRNDVGVHTGDWSALAWVLTVFTMRSLRWMSWASSVILTWAPINLVIFSEIFIEALYLHSVTDKV